MHPFQLYSLLDLLEISFISVIITVNRVINQTFILFAYAVHISDNVINCQIDSFTFIIYFS
jgi:hypothetical protein